MRILGRSPGRAVRLVVAGVIALATVALDPGVALGHSPNPWMGGSAWSPDQAVGYRWKAGAVPPSWLQAAFSAAAADSNATRASKAASFALDPSGASTVAYNPSSMCTTGALACIDRTGVPSSFGITFRRQGYVFQWGKLNWCQAFTTGPNGCFDVENIALDELGHAQGIGHHVNYAGDTDYADSVVQTFSRQKPAPGYNTHAYGRCDVALLQLSYDMRTWSAPYSTCLALATTLALGAAPTSVTSGGAVTFTATLAVAATSAYQKLSANPVTARTVRLQRRLPGATGWSDVAVMPTGPASGKYAITVNPTATADWRAVFSRPPGEGLLGSTSGTVTIEVTSGGGPGCPPQCPTGPES